jgi:isopentenyl phosphate kinase
MLTFVKLGGSLITDKRVEQAFRAEIATRVAFEIAQAIDATPQPLIIGHGSGSFGHFPAHVHGTMDGVSTRDQWRGFAEVALAAADLNALMAHVLWEAGVPIWRIQPSASLIAQDGIPQSMAVQAIHTALANDLVPLVYGDVALDTTRGGTIVSTESLFTYLAQVLPVTKIVLVGEVGGVLDEAGKVIPRITPDTVSAAKSALKGSSGTDVTGGMLTKVTDMVALVERKPSLTIKIVNGTVAGVLQTVLTDPAREDIGTTISAG